MHQVGQQTYSQSELLGPKPPVSMPPPSPPKDDSNEKFADQRSDVTPNDIIRKADVDDLMCDACDMKKRYKTMSWWWDETCLKILCEHCGIKEHRSHQLKVHGDAERCHNDEYGKFVEITRSEVAAKLAMFTEGRKFPDLNESLANDVVRFQNANENLIDSLESTVKAVNNELSFLSGVRLTHATYTKRKAHRESVSKITETVSDMLYELQSQSKDLLAQLGNLNERETDLCTMGDGDY